MVDWAESTNYFTNDTLLQFYPRLHWTVICSALRPKVQQQDVCMGVEYFSHCYDSTLRKCVCVCVCVCVRACVCACVCVCVVIIGPCVLFVRFFCEHKCTEKVTKTCKKSMMTDR